MTGRPSRFFLACLWLACLAGGPLRAADAGAVTTGMDATVLDEADAFTLSNGLVTAIIDKKNAEVKSIWLAGGRNLVTRGGVTFDAEAFGVGKNQAGLYGSEGSVVSTGADVAEVKFTKSDFIGFLSVEMHFVMKRGVPGIYEYLVMKHGAGQPGGSVGQLRWVFRGDAKLLTRAYASSGKQGQMISNDAFEGAQTIADATFRLTKQAAANIYKEPIGRTHDGQPVYSKYDWTDYAADHAVHGFSSDTEGIFMVQPSMEYYNGGPTKGILTVHNGPVSILEFLGGHFLIRDGVGVHPTEGQEWSQIIGPWLVYLNKGANPDALWRDAFQRGQQEKASWPYAWVREPEELYPHQRGAVTGTLTLPDRKAAGALIVLARPDKDWQTQTMGYEFWTRADADGHFVIPKVRPGNYALYASVPGVIGEMKMTDLIIAPGKITALGSVVWNPPARKELLWRVGTPDRSTMEFRFGNAPRQFGLWWRYMQEMGTRELTYTIGQSTPAKNWYYAQSVVPMPNGSYFSPVWNIRFDLKSAPAAGPMLLTVDLAGAAGGNNRLHVSVNGQEAGVIDSVNDSGIYRSAVRSANFRHHTLEFDSALLKPGANKVTFVLEARGNWKTGTADSIITTDTGGMPEIPSAGVMYDCIQLEAGPVVGDDTHRLIPDGPTR